MPRLVVEPVPGRHRLVWSAAALVLVAGCGGAVVAALGTLGAGGGDWLVDATPDVAGYQPLRACPTGGNDLCRININPGSLYQRDYAVTGDGNHGGCAARPTGQVRNAVDVSIPGCFTGTIVSVNEAVSNDGRTRAYFDFVPDMSTGTWVDIHDETHRFVFGDNVNGVLVNCEIVGGVKRPVTLTVESSNFRDFADDPVGTKLVPRTTVQSLTVTAPTVRTFTGEFVGASALRLQRTGETIELLRRDVQGSCG